MLNRFTQWLFSLKRPVRWLVLLLIIAVITLTAITVSATTWEYTNSPEFCGTVCHTMPPEYTAYQVSPHARVDCVDCHLGQDSLLMTVPRKAREVSHVVNALTQAYEPPIYVKSLRPARDTCEKCHNPEKFSSDTFVEIKRYSEDEENTETRNFMIIKTGGGTRREGLGRGIHWHIENEVWYYSDDLLKQNIPYVKEIRADGETIEYFDVESGLPDNFGQQVESELRRMDCIDCHTRISHLFRSPSDAMDDALARQQIDPDIPEIKRKGVELLSQEFDSTNEGLAEIDTLIGWYQENYPDYYNQNQETVETAVQTLKETFTQTVFPNMEVGWQTHPNNVGHKEFPGCFRCHDGKHTSAEGQTVRLECNLCHSIPEVVNGTDSTAPVIPIERPDEPDSHKDSNWIAQHRYVFDETCAECHEINNPGGTDNSGFCANSGCHATEWKFVGLDAPAIRELVAPPQVPGTGVPRAVPHPIGGQIDCTICHGPEELLAYPDDHTGYEQNLCTLCHEPTLLTAGEVEAEAITVPAIPHLTEGHENGCLECHGLTEVTPFPENHTEWSTDSCLFCHQVEAKPEAVTEDESKRPLIPHAVAGAYENCLFCHNLGGIKPFPANRTHEAEDLDKCQVCHKQQTES